MKNNAFFAVLLIAISCKNFNQQESQITLSFAVNKCDSTLTHIFTNYSDKNYFILATKGYFYYLKREAVKAKHNSNISASTIVDEEFNATLINDCDDNSMLKSDFSAINKKIAGLPKWPAEFMIIEIKAKSTKLLTYKFSDTVNLTGKKIVLKNKVIQNVFLKSSELKAINVKGKPMYKELFDLMESEKFENLEYLSDEKIKVMPLEYFSF